MFIGPKQVIDYIKKEFEFLLTLGFTVKTYLLAHELEIVYRKGKNDIDIYHDFNLRDHYKNYNWPFVVLICDDFEENLLKINNIFDPEKLEELKLKAYQKNIFSQIKAYAAFVKDNIDSILSHMK
jgi:hypothetical protein